MEVVALKMSSGDEVIGRLVSETDATIIIGTARVLIPAQGREPGTIAIQLLPWLFSVDADGNTPPINKANVVLVNNQVPKHLADMYISETSSIQLVN